MYISRIRLRQFRSYENAEFYFDPGVNIITGPNGVGKTNLLEAVYLFKSGKSFRDNDDKLAQYDMSEWLVSADVDDGSREVRFQGGKKLFRINDTAYQRLTPRLQLPIVLFEPDDLLLIHGSPSKRRQYLDMVASIIFPDHNTVLRRFERALAQRNKLLKESYIDEDNLFVWDISFAEAADILIKHRTAVVGGLMHELSSFYSHISGKSSQVAVMYHNSVNSKEYKQALLSGLKHNLPKERVMGFTSIGPHRDDIEFRLDGKNMLTSASRGEIRSLVLSLKRFEINQQQHRFQTTPLLLLDDVFSELDEMRQKQLIREFYIGQTIITSTQGIYNIGKEIPLSTLL